LGNAGELSDGSWATFDLDFARVRERLYDIAASLHHVAQGGELLEPRRLLIDYKVRILDSKAATGARVRVLVESTDGTRYWTTVGSSTDIIEASWLALADALEYALTAEGKRPTRHQYRDRQGAARRLTYGCPTLR
jgi:hypothetical protein